MGAKTLLFETKECRMFDLFSNVLFAAVIAVCVAGCALLGIWLMNMGVAVKDRKVHRLRSRQRNVTGRIYNALLKSVWAIDPAFVVLKKEEEERSIVSVRLPDQKPGRLGLVSIGPVVVRIFVPLPASRYDEIIAEYPLSADKSHDKSSFSDADVTRLISEIVAHLRSDYASSLI
jgi:hypothetical protein